MKYRVHCYMSVRLPIEVEADDHTEAMKLAGAKARELIDVKEPAEFADDIDYYLVDEDGDPEFLRTRWYDGDYQPPVDPKASLALVEAVAQMKLEDEVEGGVENDDACSDRQSIIRDARAIAGDPGYPEVE